MNKITNEKFLEIIKSSYGDEYTVLTEYTTYYTDVRVRHNICGKEFDIPGGLLKDKRRQCPYCYHSKKMNTDIFKYKLNQLVGDEYEPLSEYKNANTKVELKHTKCSCPEGEYIFKITPHGFFDGGHRCPYESHQQGYTIDVFKERLFKYFPTYKCLDDNYMNCREPIRVLCDKGHIYTTNLMCVDNGCPECRTLWVTHPEIAKLLVKPEDGNKYGFFSKTKLDFICPICSHIIHKSPYTIINKNSEIVCPYCGDGFSYPEKFFINFISQLNTPFIYQLSSKYFKWCDKYRYDFYLESIHMIVEIHGAQHYRNIGKKSYFNSVEEIQANDSTKEKLAKNNGFEYCIIDAMYSDKDYIMNNIINSQLSTYFDLSNIDWNQCNKYATSSLVYKVAEIYNNEQKNVQYISKKINISDSTTFRYLEKANELKLCDFNKKEYVNKSKSHSKGTIPYNAKPIMSLETKKIYSSMAEAKRQCGAYFEPGIVGNPNRTSAKQHWVFV